MFSLETRERIVNAIAAVVAIPMIAFYTVRGLVRDAMAARASTNSAERNTPQEFHLNNPFDPFSEYRRTRTTGLYLRLEDGTLINFRDEEQLRQWEKSRDLKKRLVKAKEEADKKCFL